MAEKYKSSFMGVCSTIANKTQIDVFLIRVLAIILLLATTGLFTIIYVLLGIFAVEEDDDELPMDEDD